MTPEFLTVYNVTAKSHHGIELRLQVAAADVGEALEVARNFGYSEKRNQPLPTSTEFTAKKAKKDGLPVSVLVRR
jgi:hypothetical protein